MLKLSCVFVILLLSHSVFQAQAALVVKVTKDGMIKTYTSEVTLQGIQFNKRHINQSVPTNVTFSITNPDGKLSNLEYTWTLNGLPLEVSLKKQEKVNDVYFTEDKRENEWILTLNLREKGLIAGEYNLSVTDSETRASAIGVVGAEPILPLFPKDKRVLDGDSLIIQCLVSGYPKPKRVDWYFAMIPVNQLSDKDALSQAKQNVVQLEKSDAYEFRNQSVTHDQLIFKSITANNSGVYMCNTTIGGAGDITYILVNVKDRWAALWPFLGIVTEVLVLVIGILLYERHQLRAKPSKTELGGEPDKARANSVQPTDHNQQQQQQNNVTEPAIGAECKTVGANESGDAKQDDVRLRGTPKC